MTKYLILHGTDASPSDNWFMWLKGKLLGKGNSVWLPQLPNSAEPNATTYTDFIFSNNGFTIDSDTILIGHSSGAVEILHILQNMEPSVKVKAAILVSAFKDDLNMDALKGLFEVPFDFTLIANHSNEIIFVHSDDDPYVPLEQAEFLAEKLDADLLLFEGQGHFNTELSPDYVKFPELLEIISSIE